MGNVLVGRVVLALLITLPLVACSNFSSSTSSTSATQATSPIPTPIATTEPTTQPTPASDETATPAETATEPSAESPNASSLNMAQASLGEISVGATESEVREMLGNPLIIKYEETACCGELRHLEYQTLSVGIAEGTVYSLLTRSPDMSTTNGIQVGDTQQQVIDAYGEPGEIKTENNVMQLIYYVDDLGSWTFHIEGDRLIEISYFALLN